MVAARVLDIPDDQVADEQRAMGKQIVHAGFHGSGNRRIGELVEQCTGTVLPPDQIKDFRKNLGKAFPATLECDERAR